MVAASQVLKSQISPAEEFLKAETCLAKREQRVLPLYTGLKIAPERPHLVGYYFTQREENKNL